MCHHRSCRFYCVAIGLSLSAKKYLISQALQGWRVLLWLHFEIKFSKSVARILKHAVFLGNSRFCDPNRLDYNMPQEFSTSIPKCMKQG
jgi:hypothetical protein